MNNDQSASAPKLEDVLASHGRSQGRRRLLTAFFIVSLIGAGLVLVPRFGKSEQPAAVQYKTEAVTRGDLVVTVSATGNLEPTNEVSVGSEQSGTVKSVLVDCNDAVKVGQVLAQLDTTKILAEIAQVQAQLASAKAQLLSVRATVREDRDNLRRLKELLKISTNKAVSQKDLDSAQANLDRALAAVAQDEAAVQQNEASLHAYQIDLSKMTIRSPIKGVVLSRSIDPGQTVAASFETPTLFTLAEDLSKMQLKVGVDEADIGSVLAGQKAAFTVDAYGANKFSAIIRRVNYGSTTTDNVVTYKTILDVDNKNLKLRPGMTATAVITVKEVKGSMLIPNTALRFEPPAEPEEDAKGGSIVDKIMPRPPAKTTPKAKSDAPGDPSLPVVWTLKDGKLTSLRVKTGATDGTKTEVLDGDVQSGMELVVDTVTKASS